MLRDFFYKKRRIGLRLPFGSARETGLAKTQQRLNLPAPPKNQLRSNALNGLRQNRPISGAGSLEAKNSDIASFPVLPLGCGLPMDACFFANILRLTKTHMSLRFQTPK